MRYGVRMTLAATILAALLLLVAWLSAMSGEVRRERTVTGVDIAVLDSSSRKFVTAEDVSKVIGETCGTILGQRLDSIPLRRIEESLEGRGAIRTGEAYTTPDGILHVEITQREPVIMFRTDSSEYYADKDGYVFPHIGKYSQSVTVIDGALPMDIPAGFRGKPETEKEQQWLAGMIGMMQWIQGEPLWKGAIKRISVDRDGDLTLYPREGKERFLFGHPDNIEKKFSRMEDYYRYIVPSKEEGYYTTVNVKFRGQIVCSRDGKK